MTSEWRQEGKGRFALEPRGLYLNSQGNFRLIAAIAGGDERLSGFPRPKTCSGYFVFVHEEGRWVYDAEGPNEADATAFLHSFNLALYPSSLDRHMRLPNWLERFDKNFKANPSLQHCK